MDPESFGGTSPESFSDTYLHLESAKKGAQTAYDELFARFRPGLEMILELEIRRTSGDALRRKLAADAEDLLQETVVKGFEKIAEIDYLGPGSVLGYFKTILRNRIHNFRTHFTTDKRDVGREVDGVPEGAPTSFVKAGPAEPGAGPATIFGASEMRERVADALETLREVHRELLILRFFGGASWAEIAGQLDFVTPDAARMECRNHALPAFALALSR